LINGGGYCWTPLRHLRSIANIDVMTILLLQFPTTHYLYHTVKCEGCCSPLVLHTYLRTILASKTPERG